MEIFIRKVVKNVLLTAVLLSASLSFAKDDSNRLRVGFLSDMPYLMSVNPDSGCMEGYGYDYLQMISNFTGWEYEYVHGEWYVLWEKFLKGEIDILEDISYVPERESSMLFPNVPMGREIYRLYVCNTESTIQSEKLEETLSGKKVGVTAGTIQHKIFTDWLKKRHISCNVIPYNSDFVRNDDLEDGKIDAVVELEASSINTWEPVIEIGSTDYYLALSKGNEKHLEELNRALNSLESVMPDFNNSLFYNYYSRTIVSRRLSDSEVKWAKEHKVIRCGYFDDLISNSPDDPGVFEIVMDEIRRLVELSDLYFEYVYYQSTDEMLEDLQTGKIDVGYPLCAFPGSSEMGKYSVVSNIGTLMISSVTKKTIVSPFDVKTVGIPSNGNGYFHAKKSFPKANVILYDNPLAILDDVASGKIEVGTLPYRLIHNNIFDKKKYADLNVVQLTAPFETSIAVKRGNVALYQLLRRGVSLMDSSFIKDVVASNTIIQVDYSFKTFMSNHIFFVVLVMLAFFMGTCTLIVSSVRRQTMKKNFLIERNLRNQLLVALRQTEEHQKKERELLYLSETDKLTGISNRGAEGKIKEFISVGTFGMFALFDVDKFKLINDNYGHLAGDKVLVAIADSMKKTFRDSDVILRLGGDEFAVFAIGITDKKVASDLIDRFFAEIGRISIPELMGSKIYISLGATFVDSTENIDYENVYKKADKGCYISKREDGNYSTFC